MPTSVRLTSATEKRLNQLATKTGRSMAFYIREMIETGLPEIEEIYLAEQIAVNVSLNKEKTYTLDEVEQYLAVED